MPHKRWSVALCVAGALVLAAGAGFGEEHAETRAAIGRVVDDFHDAAARADGARYFGHLTRDAVFLGTDATERWPRAAFESFARPYFEKGRGWAYVSKGRHVDIERNRELAWFDELLENAHYGTCRGSGVVRREDGRWRIAQYNLSIPIPNPLARSFVARIRAHERGQAATRVVYVVRHAEKATNGEDPPLTDAGRARAEHLARVLRSARVGTVYATEYRRTQQTVAPTARACGLVVERYAARETAPLAETLRTLSDTQAALVAGHSNTVPDLLQHLGVKAEVAIDDRDYDNLFVVTVGPGSEAHFQWLHYGE